jgi:alpha-beta hydrolase superfamily lysophospholipase
MRPIVLMIPLGMIGLGLLLLSVATSIPLLALLGVTYLLGALAIRASARATRWRLVRSFLAGVFVVAGAFGSLGMAYLWWSAPPLSPGAFYDPPAGALPRPGTLLRSEPLDRPLPPNARAWRILYATTQANNDAAVASAVVLAPASSQKTSRPVVAWTHGTTGIEPGCAPSVLPAPAPFDRTVPAIDQLVERGWVLVGTDYVGLGTRGPHPYLIGEGEARSALDAVRAARSLGELSLDTRTVFWGHSQGGHAALWSGILAPLYAEDVDVIGVAALAPATELAALIEAIQDTPVGRILSSFIMAAYGQAYPDVHVDEYVALPGRARAMAGRCLSGPGAVLSVLTSLTMETSFFKKSPSGGALGVRFRQNTPGERIAAPVLIAQGLADDLVLPWVQDHFVRRRCESGQSLEYRTYEGRDHISVVAPDSPLTADLVEWTSQRFAGTPVPDGCRTVAR